MRSPSAMSIIQIELTNACVNQCSHCSRFCGHHNNPFFMDFSTFRRAVDSLRDFPGIVGIMGGEPLLHPQFREFMQYYRDEIHEPSKGYTLTYPVTDFDAHNHQPMTNWDSATRRGLWSSTGPLYRKYFELCQDIFPMQALNDHTAPNRHRVLMLSRKELGIPDEEWIPLRDACHIQNSWSASVTPKGAFFCEVAGALDMLLHGPGGWPIEPGWWKRTPEEFGNQVQWCEICGGSLSLPWQYANRRCDYVSPEWERRLQDIASPRYAKGRTRIFTAEQYRHEWNLVYKDPLKQVKKANQLLAPAEIALFVGISACLAPESVRSILDDVVSLKTKLVVILQNQEHLAEAQSRNIKAWFLPEGMETAILQKAREESLSGWMLLYRDKVPTTAQLAVFSDFVFNPGCLYTEFQGERTRETTYQFFHGAASSLADLSGHDSLASCFPPEKRITLERGFTNPQHIYLVSKDDVFCPEDTVFRPLYTKHVIESFKASQQTGLPKSPLLAALRRVWEHNGEDSSIGFTTSYFLPIFSKDFGKNDQVETLTKEHIAQYALTAHAARAFTQKYDLVLPYKTNTRMLPGAPLSCQDALSRLYGEPFFLALSQVFASHSSLAEHACAYFKGEMLSTEFAFVMRRALFQEFCALLFPFWEALRVSLHTSCTFSEEMEESAAAALLAVFARSKRKQTSGILSGIRRWLTFSKRSEYTVGSIPFLHVLKPCPPVRPLPPPTRGAVTLCSCVSDASACAFSLLLASLSVTAKSGRHYEFVVLYKKLSEDNRQALQKQAESSPWISLCFVPVNSLDRKCFQWTGKADDQISGLYSLSSVFPRHRKVLWLSPFVSLSKDPAELFTMDLGKHCVAAATDPAMHVLWESEQGDSMRERWLLPPYPPGLQDCYINPDFMLCNLVEWRKQGLDGIMEELVHYHDFTDSPTDLINCVLNGSVHLMSKF